MRLCSVCKQPNRTRQSKCRDCYNSYMREYMKNRFHAKYAEAKEYLGGRCVDCGSTDNLEFDHVDRNSKTGDIGDLWSSSNASFWTEVRKCVLRCKPHHAKRTSKQLGVEHGGGLSGKDGCKCDPCRARKAQYMKERQPKYLEAKRQRKRLEREARNGLVP